MQKILRPAPIIGFVRYSQYRKFGNMEKERDMFEPEYFEYRFQIFKNVTLKSFQQQTDKNFVLLLLHSENMPQHLKIRFLELEKSNLFLYNIFVEDTDESFNESLRKSIEYASFEEKVAVTFRIDNDDAVQNDFVQKLAPFLKLSFEGYVISMPTVSIVKRITNQLYMVEERYYPSNSIGLAYVTGRENYQTVIEVGHHDLLNDEISMILLAKNEGVNLQTINGENALNLIDRSKAKIMNKIDFDHYLRERKIEDLKLDCLRILPEENISSGFSLKKTLKLFVPPIFFLTVQKIRYNYQKGS